MVQIEWKKILSLSPNDLTEEEKDDLCDTLAWCNIDPSVDNDRLNVLFTISQEILKHKANQVDMLVAQLDGQNANQKEKGSQRHQKLLEELEDLRAQVASFSRPSSRVSKRETEELKRELSRSEIYNEELQSELETQNKTLLEHKRTIEELTDQVASLEKERSELQRELAAINNDAQDQRGTPTWGDSPEEDSDKVKELAESIRHKNKHIKQLLDDLEVVEKENLTLRDKIMVLGDELADGTKQMTKVAGELSGLRLTCREQEEKLNRLQGQNEGLRVQIEDLVKEKQQKDDQIDLFSDAMDSRVHAWKKVMEEKNATIEELKAKLAHLAAQASNIQTDTERNQATLVMQTLQKREEQIEELQQQLAQATKELNEGAALIEELTKKSRRRSVDGHPDEVNILKLKLQQSEQQIKSLEEKLKDAEDYALTKAEEVTTLSVKLREYEAGEYGLAEAVAEIKELRQQRRVRDRHIEELVQTINQLHSEAQELEEQNVAFRERLGMSIDEVVRTDGLVAQHRKEQLRVQVLQQQTERLEEEKLQLKLENRAVMQKIKKLSEQIRLLGHEPGDSLTEVADPVANPSLAETKKPDSMEIVRTRDRNFSNSHQDVSYWEAENQSLTEGISRLEDQLKNIVEENEALRKGMHEILDSVHEQDGTSNVHVESNCLERLLEALDSRHISGWYHPAMRLQAQLQAVEGSNAVLREQLRETRLERNQTLEKLQKAVGRVAQLEQNEVAVQDLKGNSIMTFAEPLPLPPNILPSSAEIITQLETHLHRVVNEYEKEAEKNKEVEKTVSDFTKKFNVLRQQTGVLYKQYNSEKDEWQKIQSGLETEKEQLEGEIECLHSKIQEFEKHWETLKNGEDVQKKLVAESAQKMGAIRLSEVKLVRKCKALQNMESLLCKENSKMKEEMSAMETTVTRRVGELQRSKDMLAYQLSALQCKLEESVPAATLEAANRQFMDLTAKYRDLLQKEQNMICERQLSARLEEEVEGLRRDKVELQQALQEARERLHSLEVIISSLDQETVTQDSHDSQISLLSKKLATVELKELNERQRAEHADKMYQILKEQISQLEQRNTELESQSNALMQQNLELQKTEQELRDSLMTHVSQEELQQVRQKLQQAEELLVKVKLEKEQLQEIGDIAQDQVRTLELWKVSKEFQVDYLKHHILDLQSASDEKAVIGKLGHELLSARLSETATIKKVQQLKNEVAKLQAQNLRQESTLDEKNQSMNQLRTQMNNKCRMLLHTLGELRRRYSGAVPLSSQERVSLALRRLNAERRELRHLLREAVNDAHTLAVSEEVKREHAAGATELRLAELRARRRVHFLETELKQAEACIASLEEHVEILEHEQLKLEEEREQEQVTWEQSQMDLFKQLSTYKSQEASTQVVHQQTEDKKEDKDESSKAQVEANLEVHEQLKQTLNLVSSQSQNLLKYEAELSHLRSKVASLSEQLDEKVKLLAEKDKVVAELRTSLANTIQSPVTRPLPAPTLPSSAPAPAPPSMPHAPAPPPPPVESVDKLALKATVESLQNILTQKEETIGRYQALLAEVRREHSDAMGRLKEQLNHTQEALEREQMKRNKFSKPEPKEPVLTQKLARSVLEKYAEHVNELQDEKSELRTVMEKLHSQLHSFRAEATRWKALAEDRLQNMGELQQRLEEQHHAEIQSYRSETEHLRQQLEETQQGLALAREDLRVQEEAVRRGPSAVLQSSVAMLRSQLQEKDAKLELLSRTIVKLQGEIKHLVEASTREALDKPELAVIEMAATAAGQGCSEPEAVISYLKKQVETVLAREKALAAQLESAKQANNRFSSSRGRSSSRQRVQSADGRASTKEGQLQKRIKSLENLLEETKNRQEKENAENEARKVKSAEEVARWNEQKRWQQVNDKLKETLKEKTSEIEKLYKTTEALKATITRLEREKRVLNTKLKSNKGVELAESRVSELELDKSKLHAEIAVLKGKLEMQQHHAGGLGAAMLEERLEAQQRRIAALELSKKGNPAVAETVEKLQKSNAVFQKTNVQLESENLALRLDLEKAQTETPRLRDQVQHLEKYVELLKAEERQMVIAAVPGKGRDVDRLKARLQQAQNKKEEFEEKYIKAQVKVNQLEVELNKAKACIKSHEESLHLLQKDGNDRGEIHHLRAQLLHKAELLEKVKILLKRAADKEKSLQTQVRTLQALVPDVSSEGQLVGIQTSSGNSIQ